MPTKRLCRSILLLTALAAAGCASPYHTDRGALFGGVMGAGLGAVAGAGLGFVLGVVGVAPDVIRRLSFVIGLALGLVVSIVPIRMVLGKDFGEFRLVLLANTTSPAPAGLPR